MKLFTHSQTSRQIISSHDTNYERVPVFYEEDLTISEPKNDKNIIRVYFIEWSFLHFILLTPWTYAAWELFSKH